MADIAEFDVFCPGVLEVLSIGKGDLKLSVGDNPEDRGQARTLIEEMLRKGYSIFVETDSGPERVYAFNANRMTYTIADGPDAADEADAPAKKPTPRKRRTKDVPVGGSRATAVGRTAGG